MFFPTIIFALAAWLCQVAEAVSTAPEDSHDCFNVHDVLYFSEVLHVLPQNSVYTQHPLPAIPPQYMSSLSSCLPKSLTDQFTEPLIQFGRDHMLPGEVENSLRLRSKESRNFRGSENGLERRIRDSGDDSDNSSDNDLSVEDIKVLYRNVRDHWTCIGASNPLECWKCSAMLLGESGFACAACLLKERPLVGWLCCLSNASKFARHYGFNCLKR